MLIRFIIVLSLLFSLFFSQISGQNKRFFDYNEGLSNSLINMVYQDHFGFIWIATEDGLNRFDGIQFKSFSQHQNQLKDNYINTITEDSKNQMWIGLVNGLQVYSHANNTFSEIKLFIEDTQIHPFVTGIIESRSGDIWVSTFGSGLIKFDKKTQRQRYSTRLNKRFCSLNIRTIFEDEDGLIWIGSDNNGVNSFNPETEEIHHYSSSSEQDVSLPSNDITSICQDDENHIYIGSLKGGLCRLNKSTNKIERIKSGARDQNRLPVKSLLFDSKKRLWVGTDGNGMRLFNIQTKQLEAHAPPSSSFDFSKSKIHSIIEDQSGNIWAGIFQKGLFLFPESTTLFETYGYKAFGENSIGSSCVSAIDGDRNNIWIGTDGDGLYSLDKENKTVNHILLRNKEGKIDGNSIMSVNASDDTFLWAGTYANGLFRYNKLNGETRFYRNDPNDPNSIPADIITCIRNSDDQGFWLCTFGAGIVHFNPKSDQFKRGLELNDSLNSLIPQWVNDIHVDKDNNFWIGSYDGLVYVNLKKQEVKIYSVENHYLPSNVVYNIISDKAGNIWAGTFGGLVKIEDTASQFIIYNHEDGLASNVICAINENEHQNLWLSTHKGLSRLNPKENTIVNYFASDGLQANEFTRNSAYQSPDNKLFFGGINGLTEVKKNYDSFQTKAPEVMLTYLARFNEEVKIGDQSGTHTILNRSIVMADTVQLAEIDNVFSIGFTSIDLANQERITYQYMMEGFDNDWHKGNSINRTATYTNLAHGTYQFKVRGVDKKQFSEVRSLTIIIHPPWYKTRWAKSLWFIISLALIYYIIQLYKEKFRRIEVERLNDKKMQFFINISHEIRTPLSLIIDPLDKLLSQKADEETSRLYSIMQQNANRIFRLINQLLDVRKIDKGQMLIKYQETNIFDFINEVALSYQYVAKSKSIHFDIICENKNLKVWIDPLNFEKVIINLLSNAFKFTNNNGTVNIHIESVKKSEKDNLIIKVVDSGIGIKKTELEKIFERFYQVHSSETRNITGTGIGLHLSRSLVEIHKGQLYAQTGPNGVGTTFVIHLPMGNSHLPQNDLINDENALPTPLNSFRHTPMLKSSGVDHKPKTNYKIMILEDEVDIRTYLVNELSQKYKVVSYENGQQAHANILNVMPDLIISDIMMPIMDGITFCKKVKRNIETSHIPIILLTALSKEEDKAEGIETGADMYLVKPFNSDFLKKSIANLIDNRQKIAAMLEKKAEKYQLEPIEIKSHDELLMQKVMSIIKDNISSSELNVELLADGVGISRVHMHRKLKDITNQSARDLIKNVRMKQAAYILVNKKLNISEVAYSLGYTSLSHFSTSFKAYYGVSPKEYVEQQHSKTSNTNS